MSSKKNKEVIIFTMSSELNDQSSIIDVQNEYFEKELKENEGIYAVPGKKDNHKAKENITEDDTILFLYQNMFIATAKIKKDKNGEHYHELTDEIKRNWKPAREKEDWLYKEEELKNYFQFDKKTISKLPPIKRENIEIFFENKLNTRSSIQKAILKDEYINNFQNYINSKKNNGLIKKNTWNTMIKKLKKPSLLKEINLYNYENIHTYFLSNFLDCNNIYGFKDETFKKFLKLLTTKATGNNKEVLNKINKIKDKDFRIIPQKKYDDNIPDISIKINENYTIIIEGKVCSYENIYENEIKQCEKYYKHFKKNKKDKEEYVFVFLTMRKHNKDTNKEYIKITFKDIYDSLYKDYYQNNKDKSSILKEYLRSFCFLCNTQKCDFEIDEIPPVYFDDIKNKLIKKYQDLKQDIYNIADYKIPSDYKGKNQDLLYYKYILVLLYNIDELKKDKETIKKCYDNLF